MEKELDRSDLLKRPIKMIDLSKETTIGGIVDGFSDTSFQARKLAESVEIFNEMISRRDRKTMTIFLGLSGALVAAGLRKVISDMIRLRMVDVIATTGAVVYQDFYQAMGYKHYRGDPRSDDNLLHSLMIDRIYDTYVDEDKFRETDVNIGRIMDEVGGGRHSTREFLSILGERCVADQESILGAAYREGVPIYCPAIADSSIGIGLATAYKRGREEGRSPEDMFMLDTIRDNYEMAQIVHMSNSTGAVYLGGGVPKNYINDSIVMADMLYSGDFGHELAIQVTMDRADWGGLSGSTLSEAQSWGKIDEKATHSMVHVELSVALPLIAGALFEKVGWRRRKGPNFLWDGDTLLSMGLPGEDSLAERGEPL
ncbi:MAG: deoxyhypusine synthase family protein [Thermoplasmatota archaeon]